MGETAQADTSNRVVKSNQLIQSRIGWTKLEHRIVAIMIAQLEKDDEEFHLQRVHIQDLIDMTGRNGGSIYSQIEDVCKKLVEQTVEVRTETEDGRRIYDVYSVMTRCRYKEGAGYVEAKFNEDMRPMLLQLKRRFTQYGLENFMRLSSQHSMRIYELLKMREGLRFLRISVKELREVLYCEHSYERFSDFRRWVIDRAQEELHEKADIWFSYKVERKGRTPVRINFFIKSTDDNKSSTLPGKTSNGQMRLREGKHSEVTKPDVNVYEMLLEDMSQSQLNEYGTEDIRDAVEQAEKEISNRNSRGGRVTQAVDVHRKARQLLGIA